MQSWQVGEVKITQIAEMELPIPYNERAPFMPAAKPEALKEMPWLYPHYVSPEGHLRLSIHALLVEAPGLRLVVDTCVGNDKPRGLTGGRALQTDFMDKFIAAGWPRESVDCVVCTHLHVDHVGWNTMKLGDSWVPTFPNARYLIGRDEYEFWIKDESDDQVPVMADSVTPIFDAGLADLVATDHVISPNIKLMPTIGHTPGHVSVMIESEGEKAMITGDFIHHPCQIAHPDWTVSFDVDQSAAAACRDRVLGELADSSVLVIGTHFAAPTAGNIVSDGDSYKFVT
ncbi:MAG: MBL fold metallo-hydrolase [Pseudomonadales bacterium]|jgi:glyoxylase-like metal-dependent hydrolase (beta-lactamase superfamily II)